MLKSIIIPAGKSAEVAERKLEIVLRGLGDVEIIAMSDSGLRIILIYREKALAKNTESVIIKEKEDSKELGDGAKSSTSDGARGSTSGKRGASSRAKKS